MDLFQIRMDFSSQLRRLNASQASIQKVLATMARHTSRASDDLWDCIVRETGKASLNARLNVLFLIDALVTGAEQGVGSGLDGAGGEGGLGGASGSSNAGGGAPGGSSSSSSSSSASSSLSPLVLAAFLPLIRRDLVALIECIVPLTPDGVRLNLASTRQVVSSWRTTTAPSVLPPALIKQLLARLEARRAQLLALPPEERQSETEFSKTEVLQRIEEDRERQKRLRERSWILPSKTYVNAIPHPPPPASAASATSSSAAGGASSSHAASSKLGAGRAGTTTATGSSSGNATASSSAMGGTTASAATASRLAKKNTTSLSSTMGKSTNQADLTRDPLAALYGDAPKTPSVAAGGGSATSAVAAAAAARKSMGAQAGGSLTPAKRKANGALVAGSLVGAASSQAGGTGSPHTPTAAHSSGAGGTSGGQGAGLDGHLSGQTVVEGGNTTTPASLGASTQGPRGPQRASTTTTGSSSAQQAQVPPQPPAPPPPPPNDALHIEMSEMWETTSDLNEDDFEAFAEEDGVGAASSFTMMAGGGGVPTTRSAPAAAAAPGRENGQARTGVESVAGAAEADGSGGGGGGGEGVSTPAVRTVTILGVAAAAAAASASATPSTTTAPATEAAAAAPGSTLTTSKSIAPLPTSAVGLVPRWWGSRALFVAQEEQDQQRRAVAGLEGGGGQVQVQVHRQHSSMRPHASERVVRLGHDGVVSS